MPFFAVAHLFAFSHTDYIDPALQYSARMPFYYAVRDSFGLLDVLEDSRATFRGGVSYKSYEPVEGGMHVGAGRDRRIRAGLRYSKGGQQKYWLPMPTEDELVNPSADPIAAVRKRWDAHRGYAPLMLEQEDDVVHDGPSFRHPNSNGDSFVPDYIADDDDNLSLDFGERNSDEDRMYDESRKFLFGDYNYPVIDVSSEAARMQMWDEEERILRDERAAAYAWPNGAKRYGATDVAKNPIGKPTVKEQQTHPAIIDYEQQFVPDFDIKGIHLKWTKGGTVVPKASRTSSTGGSHSRSPRPDYMRRKSSKNPSKLPEDPQPEHVSDPNTSNSDDEHMPDDAIDLVVEDKEAGVHAMEQERRGEPAMVGGTGLKKVYRRKYRGHDDKGKDKEVEVEEQRDVGENPGDLPDKMKVKIQEDPSRSTPQSRGSKSPWLERDELFSPTRDVTDVTIARETTPPPHARVEVRNYRVMSDVSTDGNPWA